MRSFHIQEQFIARGGVLKSGNPVISIDENRENGVITIETEKESFTGKKLIICAGTWINRLLEPLGKKLDVKVRFFLNFIFFSSVLVLLLFQHLK